MSTRVVDIEVTYETRTDMAICFRPEELVEVMWVPRSLAEMDPPNASRGDIVTITVPEWWATQEGLI